MRFAGLACVLNGQTDAPTTPRATCVTIIRIYAIGATHLNLLVEHRRGCSSPLLGKLMLSVYAGHLFLSLDFLS